jgi:hypothetical protein
VNVGFVVDKVELEQVFLQNLLLSLVNVTTTTRFDPRPVNVGFVVDKVALEQVFLQNLLLSLVSVTTTTTTITFTVMATAPSVHFITVTKAAPYVHRHAAEYAKEHEEASQDVQGYLSNPINAYLLVKRLTTDWREVETQMVDDVGEGTTVLYHTQKLLLIATLCSNKELEFK